jgi:hypothetical protein
MEQRFNENMNFYELFVLTTHAPM